jgi:hypothetical protein
MIINNHNHLSNRSASSKLIEMKISRIRSHCSRVDSRVVTLGHKSRQFSPKRNNISLAVRGPKKARKARKSTKTTKPIPLPPGCAGAEACGRISHSKTRRMHRMHSNALLGIWGRRHQFKLKLCCTVKLLVKTRKDGMDEILACLVAGNAEMSVGSVAATGVRFG